MSNDEKLIFGQTPAGLERECAEDAAREHADAARELTSWLKYLSAEEIRGLVEVAKKEARVEIARRQGAKDA